MDGAARLHDPKPVGGQPVGLGNGNGGCRAALDPDPAGQQFLCMVPASGQAYSIIGATTAQAFVARQW